MLLGPDNPFLNVGQNVLEGGISERRLSLSPRPPYIMHGCETCNFVGYRQGPFKLSANNDFIESRKIAYPEEFPDAAVF